MNEIDAALKGLQSFFANTIKTHGAVAKGVDWKNEEAQFLRFDQLMKIVPDPTQPFSLLDYGCGYGALVGYLESKGYAYHYVGFDFTPEVIEAAQATYGHLPHVHFTTTTETIAPQEYLVASGVFNMKFAAADSEWQTYVQQLIMEQWALCTHGLSFNCLTSYSDAEYMRADLYYADAAVYFDWCKHHLSRNVALLHDYNTYDWTMLVRKTV